MSDIATDLEAERRVAAGLSPALLTHASKGQNFLGFISYRRRDGLALAKWLRDRITNFKPPAELRDKIDAIDASVGGKQNRVFFDMSYQRPNVDFWDEHIAASLCRSKTVILLQTPSVFERLDDGEPNWCEREIDTYLKYYGDPSRILVVMAPGAPIDKFPEPLANISARWDWIDLRFFSESPLQRFRYGSQYDPLVTKILAKIYNIADGDLPLLNREFAKGRARVRRALAVAACTAIVSLSGLTAWALKERDRATAAEQVAVEQRDTAIRERNAALIAQSRFLAKAADEQSNAGSARAAAAILREALPNPATGRDRPLVAEAVASAYRAIYDNREMGSIPMPPGATAVTSDGSAGRIVIATRDRLFIRAGVSPANLQEWPHDFGAATSIAIAGSGNRVVMTAANGAVMVRDLTDNRLLLRDAGAGRGTKAEFLQGGSRLLISDANGHRLQLFNLEDGTSLATHNVDSAKGRPASIYTDGDLIAVIADAKLMRLSADDLSTVATVGVPDVQEYAFALSPDRAKLFVAAADRLAVGSILCLDAATLSLQRAFGNLAFGAASMVASPTRDLLAVNTASGVDFFDTKKFETMGHVTAVPLSGGRFLKDSFFYIGYNPYGDILQVVPELLTTTAYKTIDGGGIRQIDVLADGFLSLSDKPSITRWAFESSTSSKNLAIPFVIKNIDMKMSLTIGTSDFNKDDGTVVASYFGDQVKRWNLEDGSSKTVKDADPQFPNKNVKVAGLGKGVALVALASGTVEIYDEAAGSAKPLTHIETGPVETLVAVSPTSAFAVSKGEPRLLDVSDASHPKTTVLTKLGDCPRSGGGLGIAVCVGKDGSLRALRIPDNQLVADLPPPAAGLLTAFVTENGNSLLFADTKGNVEWRKGNDANQSVKKWAMKGTLQGQPLAIALARGLLSPADAAEVRAGTTSVEVPMSPIQFEVNEDQTQIAAVFPNGAMKLLSTQDDKVIDIPARDGRFVSSLKFSRRGNFLAVIDHVDDAKVVRAMMVVYNTTTGSKMFAFNTDPQVLSTVQALPSGRGFVTINPRGMIRVHPVYDQAADLITYLAEKFPIPLTPSQRHAFFIE